jgi:nucleoside-diphosphate-sugar epimerase
LIRIDVSQEGPAMSQQQELHVVVGSGPVGTAVAGLLADSGRRVRVVTRSGSGPDRPEVERVAADAADAPRLAGLARGATAIYNCVNPAYHRWASDWPPVAAAILGAAQASGAVLATVSNLYVYGPVDAPMTERTPMAATGTKGRVRARMWLDALAAHEAGRARVTEVRASDYLGPHANAHVGDTAVKRLLRGRPVHVVGEPSAPHTWTATHDVARTLVHVAADERAWGAAWHVPSHEPRTLCEVVTDLCTLAGVRPVDVRRIPPLLLTGAALLVPFLRELPEVMHQHERPWVMDSTAARTTFGLEPTPWTQILTGVLDGVRPAATGRAAA